ncbi:hypothetical protein C0Q70_05160 [Pomacea canaliculata]|uniref:RFX1-4/6/8-like BCD domain-containing protein n=1 Tax=Pomacea canaliculata TaxID=400727 RepID=A0A2T7PKG0_POMCA|nr:hypothetical protein C0Q70_05160 [Pomacea canaliculata]
MSTTGVGRLQKNVQPTEVLRLKLVLAAVGDNCQSQAGGGCGTGVTARSVLANQEGVAQMLEDLGDVDFRQVLCQAVYTQPPSAHSYRHSIMECSRSLREAVKNE